jgi:hypothetical protein
MRRAVILPLAGGRAGYGTVTTLPDMPALMK